MTTSTPHDVFLGRITATIDPGRCWTDPATTLAYGTDASFYRLVPRVVIQAETIDEIALILREAAAAGVSVTFRAAGTSLSGQAITDSVLVLTSRHWRDLEVLDGGARIRLQPAVVGRVANAALAPYGRKIGPDPASINAAMIGGIVANNASGMCCGTAENSYRTLSSLTVVLADGTILDSGDPASVAAFHRDRPDLVARIDELTRATRADHELADRIRRAYTTKNTMGYSLNALIDHEDPIDVITHLMVGSEGTLGFIAEVVYHTVPEAPHKASALVLFPSIAAACEAVSALRAGPVSAVELMDRASLASVTGRPGVPDGLGELAADVAALLIEVRGSTGAELAGRIATATATIGGIPVERPFAFTDDPEVYEGYWNIRKGLFPAVGAVRAIGTTVIIEDVAFPVSLLAAATLDLRALFERHGYDEAVIFGHALEGNLHVVFTQDFSAPSEVDRYRRFIDDLAELVVDRYGGALKAEHGTGRNMAPFLQAQWGAEAVALMRAIKTAFDPDGILNPGVILNDSPTAHLEHLKPLPPADPLIDSCIECGFCEPSCVSNDLTFSPRQRIVVQRELARLRADGREQEAGELAATVTYQIDDTCAADGLCALACPVGIDTGRLVKQLRAGRRDGGAVARGVADHFGTVSAGVRVALRAGHRVAGLVGQPAMDRGVSAVTGLLGATTHWVPNMPVAGRPVGIGLQPTSAAPLEVVYLNACVNQIFGPGGAGGAGRDRTAQPVQDHIVNILHKADCRIFLPEPTSGLCCGLAFSSQGFAEAGEAARRRLGDALLDATDQGRRPVLCDMSPCTLEARTGLADRGLDLYDLIDFTTTFLLDRLEFHQGSEPVSLFPVCSVKKMGLEPALRRIGELCSPDVHLPDTTCCGFAGNRGMLHPELNAWGLRHLAAATPDPVTSGYSTSRTCEIGLSTHSGRPFDSLARLIDQSTTARS